MFYIVAYIACYAACYTNIHIVSHLHVEILSITVCGGLLVAELPSSCMAGLPQRPLYRARVYTPWYKCQARYRRSRFIPLVPQKGKEKHPAYVTTESVAVSFYQSSHVCAPSGPRTAAQTPARSASLTHSRVPQCPKKIETQELGDGIEPPTSG